MINSIKNGDQPLPHVTEVSIAGTTSTEQPPLKDKSMWSDQEKRVQKIDRIARSLLIQGLPNDIYSLIDSNKTAKDLWDALARHMLGFEYGEQDRKAVVLYEYKTFKATKGELLLDTYIRYLQVINDLKKCGYSKDNCELNFKFLNNLQPESKEKVVVSLDSEGSETDDFSELKKITALLAKAFNQRKFYSKTTNNNLRTSSSSQFANKKKEFVKTDNKRIEKKDDEKKRDMRRVKCYNCKKEGHFTTDCKKAKEINANMVFMAQIDKVLSDSEASSSSADEKIFENRVEKANQQSKDFENQNKDSQDKYEVLKNQTTTFVMNNKELNEQLKELIKKNNDLLAQTKVLKDQLQVKHVVIDTHVECQKKYAKLKAERYEYIIRYSAYFDNDKQHRKQIADQQVLYDKMSVQLVELDKHVRDLKNTVNLNAIYVNEKINFKDDYFQEIINPNFDKIDSPFQQTSSLKPYVPNVILEKIIIDLEDEVVNLLEKEKANLETIESLKLKSFESSENVSYESENQSENDCLVVEKDCDKKENSNVIAPEMFKLNVSQCVSPISMSKTSCDSNNIEIKLKRKRRKRKSSKQNVKQVDNDVSRANSDFVHFSDLD
nr:hypothetical protein [Tanacetum cinerariifolium]